MLAAYKNRILALYRTDKRLSQINTVPKIHCWFWHAESGEFSADFICTKKIGGWEIWWKSNFFKQELPEAVNHIISIISVFQLHRGTKKCHIKNKTFLIRGYNWPISIHSEKQIDFSQQLLSSSHRAKVFAVFFRALGRWMKWFWDDIKAR